MRKLLPRETIQLGNESTSSPRSSQRVREIDRSVVIDGACDEYRRRVENHESVDIHEFCQQYSQVYHSLVRQIEVEEYLRENPLVAQQALETAWPELGEVFFGCHIDEEIGSGAFARVYLCSQPELGNRQVVLKIARGGAYEAKTMGRLTHPNIMPVFSVEQSESHELSGICMPFLGRSTLLDIIDRDDCAPNSKPNAGVILDAATRWQKTTDRYPATNTTSITAYDSYEFGVSSVMAQVAEGLAHAHEQGVIHGDLKPTNVVLSSVAVPYIVDFNLANDRNSDRVLTGGTLAYMPPEQVQSVVANTPDFQTTKCCDVYSFGVILHQLVHGELPFELPDSSKDQSERFEAYLQQFAITQAIETPTRQNDIGRLIGACLNKEAGERPSMADVAADLRAIAERCRKPRNRFSSIRRLVLTSLLAAVLVPATLMVVGPGSSSKRADVPLVDIKAMLDAGEIDSPIEILRAKLAKSPNSNDVKFMLAQANAAKFHQRYDEPALREARRLIASLTPLHRANSVSEWSAFRHMGDREYEYARQVYEQLIAAGGVSASSWNNLGVCCERLLLKHVVDPKTAEMNMEEAMKLHIGLQTKARECYQNAVEVDDTKWLAYSNLLSTYDSGRDASPSVLSLAEKAVTRSSNRPRLLSRAAQIAAALYSQTSESQYKDKAIHYLSLASGKLDIELLTRSPVFDSMRSSEEFRKLLADSKMPKQRPPKINKKMLPDFAITCEKEQPIK